MAKRKQHQIAKRMIGRYIIADPEICHGQPTFRGTRILVADVMEQVAGGIAWETIVEGWRGDVSPDAKARTAPHHRSPPAQLGRNKAAHRLIPPYSALLPPGVLTMNHVAPRPLPCNPIRPSLFK